MDEHGFVGFMLGEDEMISYYEALALAFCGASLTFRA